jgi:hypothetical protein
MNTDGREWEGLGEEGEFSRKTGNSRKVGRKPVKPQRVTEGHRGGEEKREGRGRQYSIFNKEYSILKVSGGATCPPWRNLRVARNRGFE